ncbi:MAG: hypothetical protein GY858_06360 [Candidatus Omnitrophica bacterium]|nr:hypothetical protein [Candidatus Omnitrophota bacterium]
MGPLTEGEEEPDEESDLDSAGAHELFGAFCAFGADQGKLGKNLEEYKEHKKENQGSDNEKNNRKKIPGL